MNINQFIVPYFGYLASLLLIIALLVNSDLRFRWYNAMGNIVFIIYAIVIVSIPVLLTNAILLVINGYYLFKIYRSTENFDLLEFRGNEKLVSKFLEFYKKDIAYYFPEFNPAQLEGNLNFVVIRDLVIANIFSVHVLENGDAEILINYTTEKYRDFKVGRYIFEKERDYLFANGIKRIVYKVPYNKPHAKFLQVMGFRQEASHLVKVL